MLSNIGCPPPVGDARAPVVLVLALERCSFRIPATAVGRFPCRSCRRSWLLESDIANVAVIEIRNPAGLYHIQEARNMLFFGAAIETHRSVTTPVMFRSCDRAFVHASQC